MRRLSPTPKRGELWTCPRCGHRNEPGVTSCVNGCRQGGQRVRGPLAPPRPDEPDPKPKRGTP